MLAALVLNFLALADVAPIEPEPLGDLVTYDPTISIGLSASSCCCCSASVLLGVVVLFVALRSRGE